MRTNIHLILKWMVIVSIGILPIYGKADDILVRSFQLMTDDNTAAVAPTSRICQQDGTVAALIKIITNQKDYNIDGGIFDIVGDIVYRDGEIWVYVPSRAQKISISHYLYGSLKDYYFPEALEEGRTYRMVIDPQIGVFTDVTADMPGAIVYVDGDSIGLAPVNDYYMLYGKHILSADGGSQYGASDILVANNGDTGKRYFNIPMSEKAPDVYDTSSQQYGVLTAYGWPRGVKVAIDGEKQTTAQPISPNSPISVKLVPGEHLVKFSKPLYYSKKEVVDIIPNEELTVYGDLDAVGILPSTSIYVSALWQETTQFKSSMFRAIAGITKKNINFELGAAFPLNDYDVIKKSIQGSSESEGDVSTSSLSAKVGYKWLFFLPQVGISHWKYKYHSAKQDIEASSFYACIGYKIGVNWGHLGIFIDLEYNFMPFGKSAEYDDFLPLKIDSKKDPFQYSHNRYYYDDQTTIKNKFVVASVGIVFNI